MKIEERFIWQSFKKTISNKYGHKFQEANRKTIVLSVKEMRNGPKLEKVLPPFLLEWFTNSLQMNKRKKLLPISFLAQGRGWGEHVLRKL